MNADHDTGNEQLKDPVCNMTVSSDSEYQYKDGDKNYYFCSENCLHKFQEHPDQFIDAEAARPQEAVSESTIYTCPMHPEIRQDHPGNCPKCGMTLEPVTVSVEEDNSELNNMTRRFWVSTIMAAPAFALAMTADLVPSWLNGRGFIL